MRQWPAISEIRTMPPSPNVEDTEPISTRPSSTTDRKRSVRRTMSGQQRASHLHWLEDDPDPEHKEADAQKAPWQDKTEFSPGTSYELPGDPIGFGRKRHGFEKADGRDLSHVMVGARAEPAGRGMSDGGEGVGRVVG